MLKRSQKQLTLGGVFQGFNYFTTMYLTPFVFREQMATNNAHKVERGLRLQTAIKANKVDIRALLALPVTDPAHPYKAEHFWEKCATHVDSRSATLFGKYYKAKVLAQYEQCQMHKFGMYWDDVQHREGWFHRAARTRAPQLLVVHSDRRAFRGRNWGFKYLYMPKDQWVRPSENTPFLKPYTTMVLDEWEEKWGFFAGQDTEF